jgi:hypothetical protein
MRANILISENFAVPAYQEPGQFSIPVGQFELPRARVADVRQQRDLLFACFSPHGHPFPISPVGVNTLPLADEILTGHFRAAGIVEIGQATDGDFCGSVSATSLRCISGPPHHHE